MIYIGQLKKVSLSQLKNRWKIPAAITLITSVVTSVLMGTTAKIGKNLISAGHNDYEFVIELVAYAVIGILTTANAYFFLKMSRTTEEMSFNDFLVGLGDYWLSGILGMLWYLLWTFLWSLLFVIPGIIKGIAYSMMFNVIVENPGISVRRAMDISKALTFGHKADLFLLFLSFLGWLILCAITCGVAYIWVGPYMSIAFANTYTSLKTEAFQRGFLRPADFENN